MITPVRTQAALDDVRTLFRAYLASLPFDLDFQDFADELATLPGKYAPPTGELLLATTTHAVGCVAVRDLGDGVCEMKRLFLDPQARGHGIGKALVAAIVETARALGYQVMRLDTAADSMGAAVALYKSFGFREIPPYTPNPLPDALFLELTL